MKKFKNLLTAFTLVLFFGASAQTSATFWSLGNERNIAPVGKRQIIPQKYLIYSLQNTSLKTTLFAAPSEKSVNVTHSGCIIYLPVPDGSFQRFRVVESPIMAEALAAAFPQIKTFSIHGVDDPYASGKLDWNAFGFHGLIRSPKGDFFIDPFCVGNTKDYITYYTLDFVKDPSAIAPEIGVMESKKKK